MANSCQYLKYKRILNKIINIGVNLKVKIPKSSTMLFVNIVILLVLTIFVYVLLYKNLTLNKTKNQEVIFYQLKEKTFTLFKKVFQEHSLMKDTIFEKISNSQQVSNNNLNELYKKLNENFENTPFSIYLLDKNCQTIEQKVSDCEDNFDVNSCKNVVSKSISNPIFLEETFLFRSYVNYYLEDKEKILQIAYNFNNFKKEFEELKNFVISNDDIFTYELFINFQNKINHFIFKQDETTKSYLENINTNSFKQSVKHIYEKVGENYLHTVYFAQNSPIVDNIELFFHIIFNENKYNKDILNIKFLSIFIFLIGTITVYLIYKLRTIELLLNYKDKFIAHSIHEIKTPLSIISINIQLREKIYGSDKYTKKIDGALKTLENSYEDMTFLHTKDKIVYDIVKIDLKRALENRVAYFDTIASTQNRKIKLEIANNFYINMGKIELNRLIDNNISNAIKYSFIGSTITISLKDNILEFISSGNEIQNPKEIFKKYSRENKTTGGHGLGLAIVSDICKKYSFKIEVTSKDNLNTFRYFLGGNL